jgi:hypothetical protein
VREYLHPLDLEGDLHLRVPSRILDTLARNPVEVLRAAPEKPGVGEGPGVMLDLTEALRCSAIDGGEGGQDVKSNFFNIFRSPPVLQKSGR